MYDDFEEDYHDENSLGYAKCNECEYIGDPNVIVDYQLSIRHEHCPNCNSVDLEPVEMDYFDRLEDKQWTVKTYGDPSSSGLQLDHELTLLAAVRYAIGRKTYITDAVSNHIFHTLPVLSEICKRNIAREILEAKDQPGGLGGSCDERSWLILLEQIEDEG